MKAQDHRGPGSVVVVAVAYKDVRLRIAKKLLPLLLKPKRLKVAVGGRGGSKSMGVGDAFLGYCDAGERLCCAREFQNSIDDSVHALLKARIPELQGPDPRTHTLIPSATNIRSRKGGEIFYRGLSRNISGFKSAFGIKRLWIEEAQTLSDDTITTVLPTIREAGSEIWMTANRGSSKDAFSKHFLKPYERELKANNGYYEDSDILIVEINYWDNPFFPEELEQQRQRDKRLLGAAKYRHIWLGEYSDTVPNAIIEPDWFDACIDAHQKLGFQPMGMEVVSHDPADVPVDQDGDDKGLCYRHGVVIQDVQYKRDGNVADGADWALSYAVKHKVDEFVWDGDGMGAGLRRQIDLALTGKRIGVTMFKGAETPDNPMSVYQPIDSESGKPRTNRETFLNKRAQYYWDLRDRCFRTYMAIERKQYTNPDDLIAFSSKIKELDTLRAEICSIPQKDNASGRIQILRKEEMKRLKGPDGKPLMVSSPAGADCVMMSLKPKARKQDRPFSYVEHVITDSGVAY